MIIDLIDYLDMKQYLLPKI